MSDDRHALAKQLFLAVCAKPPWARRRYLQEQAGDDLELRREVEALLAHHDEPPEPSASLGPAAPGQVSHYRILEHLGEGGMGVVYLAEDVNLKRRVALKFLPEELTRDPERRLRFVREARAAGSVQHPNIAAIHEIGEEEGRTFIVMEYVEGRSLRERIGAGGLALDECLALLLPIADALAKAHEHGVVHRDVKPENILVADEGYPKLVDFGLAKVLDPTLSRGPESAAPLRTREGHVMGTAAYMSPEQARGEPVDARADVFALGVVLYEALTGRSPFRRGTVIESMNAVLKDDPPPVGRAGADRVLRKALAKEPSRRHQSMRELARELRDLDEGRPRRRAPRAALALVAVVVMAIGLGLARRGSARPGLGASGRPALAILHFENNSGGEEARWLSKGLPSMLLTDLAQTPGLDVVSSQRVSEILGQVSPGPGAPVDRKLGAEVARRAGAGAVVFGSIFKAGDEVRIDFQVEDVDKDRVITAGSVRGTEVFSLVDELTGRIRNGLRLAAAGTNRPLADISTRSMEAYRVYLEAREAVVNLREGAARRLYEEAVRRDPGFAMAHFELSVLLEHWDWVLARGHRQKVMANLERLSERERLVVESSYARREDPERAIRLAERLVARYPDEIRGHRVLVEALRGRGDLERSLAAIEAGVAANPASGSLHNILGYELLLYHGRPQEAMEAFRAYERLHPGEANPHDSQGEWFLLTGQPLPAIEHFNRALSLDPSFNAARFPRIWANAMLGRYGEAVTDLPLFREQAMRDRYLPQYHNFLRACVLSRVGRYVEAGEEMARGVRAAEERSDVGGRTEFSLLAAWFALERGQEGVAVREAERAVEHARGVSDPSWSRSLKLVGHLLAGAAQSRRGRTGAASAHLEAMAELRGAKNAAHSFWYHALEGERALAAHDLPGAKRAFLAMEPAERMDFNRRIWPHTMYANNLPFRDGAARVDVRLGNRVAAVEAYRALLAVETRPLWLSWLEPRYVLALARLLDAAGDAGAARAEYGRFLELWKDADEGLPELEEARVNVSAGRAVSSG